MNRAAARSESSSTWTPRYIITPAAARGLMTIEAAKAVVDRTPLPPAVEAELRQRARIRSTHYSTRIEGNRLTLAEADLVIAGQRQTFAGRERDVAEVRNYWDALLRIEEWAEKGTPLSEDLIRRLHARVEKAPRARPTPYRDGQNAIRDSASGAIVYMPPEASDVPAMMAAMVRWTRHAEAEGLPAPIIAALVHYQFVTIHPFYDGNGRTARLLATLLLHRGGYGLNGFFSLEEHHARDLDRYYAALVTHPHHNYYLGRGDADLTGWVDYFIATLSSVFEAARVEAEAAARRGVPEMPEALRRLDHRARTVLGLFAGKERITAGDVARVLGLSERMVRLLLREWVVEGWLEIADPSNRARNYQLSANYRQYIGRLPATPAAGPFEGT